MTGYAINETGRRYGMLFVVGREENGKSRNARWLCRCDCGNSIVVAGSRLRSGETYSCGCLNKERQSQRMKQVWKEIKKAEREE